MARAPHGCRYVPDPHWLAALAPGTPAAAAALARLAPWGAVPLPRPECGGGGGVPLELRFATSRTALTLRLGGDGPVHFVQDLPGRLRAEGVLTGDHDRHLGRLFHWLLHG